MVTPSPITILDLLFEWLKHLALCVITMFLPTLQLLMNSFLASYATRELICLPARRSSARKSHALCLIDRRVLARIEVARKETAHAKPSPSLQPSSARQHPAY